MGVFFTHFGLAFFGKGASPLRQLGEVRKGPNPLEATGLFQSATCVAPRENESNQENRQGLQLPGGGSFWSWYSFFGWF